MSQEGRRSDKTSPFQSPGQKHPPQVRGQAGEGMVPEEQRWRRQLRLPGQYPPGSEGSSWTPWLLIRAALSDLGMRPFALPGVFHWWTSPDIWIEPHGRVVANEDNFVWVRVFNLGMADAIPVKVDFYWASSAVSLSPATAHLIGTEWVEIHSLTSKEIRCSTPHRPISDMPILAQTLVVNCTNPILDPITHPFQANLDRHVGPHSLAVIPATPGETIELSLDVHNPFPLRAKTAIAGHIEHVFATDAGAKLEHADLVNYVVAYGTGEPNMPQEAEPQSLMERALRQSADRSTAWALSSHQKKTTQYVRGFREFAHPVRSAAQIRSELSTCSTTIRPAQPGRYLSDLMVGMDAASSGGECYHPWRDIPLQDVVFRPFEKRALELELQVPADARTGEYLVCYLTQRAEGMLLGGYTIVAQVVEQ